MAFVPPPGYGPNCLKCFGPRDYAKEDKRRAVCNECADDMGLRANNKIKARKSVKAYWGYRALATG